MTASVFCGGSSDPPLDAVKEQVAAAACSTENRPYIVGVKGKSISVWRPDCKMWKCPYCGKALARHIVHVIAYGVHVYMDADPWQSWSFVTLTARGDRRGMTRSLDDFRKGWPKLRKRIGRAYPYKLHYAAVPERHNDDAGTVHMHMLLNVRFEDARRYAKRDGSDVWYSRTLARMATGCGLGWSHDARPLESETMVAAYMTKYATKHIADADWPSNMMHYRTSQHWPRHQDHTATPSGFSWFMVKPDHLFSVMAYYASGGFHIAANV